MSTSMAHLIDSVPKDPWILFSQWWQEVQTHPGIREKNAMSLATAETSGVPMVRTVLLKEFSPLGGLVFYTNYQSRKGRQLETNPKASLLFYWDPLFRQVLIQGNAVPLDRAQSEAYWQSRPRESQLSGWLSKQSEVIPSGLSLNEEYALLERKFSGQPIPCPPHWGGFAVIPHEFEFWLGHVYRLHDRIRYTLNQGRQWGIQAIYP